jgi:hypothetical protein
MGHRSLLCSFGLRSGLDVIYMRMLMLMLMRVKKINESQSRRKREISQFQKRIKKYHYLPIIASPSQPFPCLSRILRFHLPVLLPPLQLLLPIPPTPLLPVHLRRSRLRRVLLPHGYPPLLARSHCPSTRSLRGIRRARRHVLGRFCEAGRGEPDHPPR